jgi:citronellyl-CoA dehydrogenase
VGKGFQQQMAQFVVERMWANYSVVGAMDRALQRTRDYTQQRRVFGNPLATSDFVAYKLAELAAEVDMLRHYNYACAESYMAGEDTTRFAAIAKFKAGRLSREVADWCLQFHGGIGYMEETWTARFFRDTRLNAIGGGADEVMLNVIARIDGYSG